MTSDTVGSGSSHLVSAWKVTVHIYDGYSGILSPAEAAAVIEKLQLTTSSENHRTDWIPKWKGDGYAGVELVCSNPPRDLPRGLRQGFGLLPGKNIVDIWIYDDYITVKGAIRDTHYIDKTELEAQLLGIVASQHEGMSATLFPYHVREIIQWRKDPDAPR
jgi:hypothetical protein